MSSPAFAQTGQAHLFTKARHSSYSTPSIQLQHLSVWIIAESCSLMRTILISAALSFAFGYSACNFAIISTICDVASSVPETTHKTVSQSLEILPVGHLDPRGPFYAHIDSLGADRQL
ncbi:hypothetical protein FBU30_004455 [Linnemannia zychae]|nr:hypothetical protein FBU30_004455 [Linnemannia zychae]